jgi:hypothetical protein
MHNVQYMCQFGNSPLSQNFLTQTPVRTPPLGVRDRDVYRYCKVTCSHMDSTRKISEFILNTVRLKRIAAELT